jgi:hypothetical protein
MWLIGCGKVAAGSDASIEAGTSIHDEWVNYCLALTSCNAFPISFGMTHCVTAVSGWFPDQSNDNAAWGGGAVSCIVDAGASCDAVYTCTNLGRPSATCDAGVPGIGLSCTGTVLDECNQGHVAATDCSATGTMCTPLDALYAICTLGTCAVHGMTCNSDKELCCAQEAPDASLLQQSEDCSTFAGAACNPSALGDVGGCMTGRELCIGSGLPCTSDACNGTTFAACLSGRQATVDCNTRFALGCTVDDAGTGHCARGSQCDEGFQDSCTGSVLTFCDDGEIATVDCVARGWKGCTTIPMVPVTIATCSP